MMTTYIAIWFCAWIVVLAGVALVTDRSQD